MAFFLILTPSLPLEWSEAMYLDTIFYATPNQHVDICLKMVVIAWIEWKLGREWLKVY